MATKKQPRKVALINVKDFPKSAYAVYWEIRVDGNDQDGYGFGARLYDYVTGKVVKETEGTGDTRDAVDTAAQTWVNDNIKTYRRPPTTTAAQTGYALALGPFGLLVGPLGMLWELAADSLRRLLNAPLLALGYTAAVCNSMLDAINTAINAGAGAGLIRIYDGTRPATCGTATTLLAELTCTDPAAPAASGGVLIFSAITADSSANATGTAAWFRLVDSTGTCVYDGNCGTSGSDLNFNSLSISIGQQVSISSMTITEGNP